MEFDIYKLKESIKSAIESVYRMFSSLLERETYQDNKRAHLLSYWIKTYTEYILKEDAFSSSSMIRYKRGNVVQVEFGYRVGSELGGLHYAVVIDNDNSLYSDVVTVVPLGSLKDTYRKNRYTFVLKDGVYDLLNQKLLNQKSAVTSQLSEYGRNLDFLSEQYYSGVIGKSEYRSNYSKIHKSIKELEKKIDRLDKTALQMGKLKKGTIVNTGQIITVSKMRIVNPKITSDSMYGIRLTKDDLDLLNDELKKLYIYSEKNT